MAYALVGSKGAVSQSASGAALTPAWGTSENRTAGNLLILWVTTNVLSGTTAPSGWSSGGSSQGGSENAAFYYKVATGADAAPTISAVTSGIITAQLAEFSGNASSTPVDVGTGTNGATSPLVSTGFQPDVAAGELVIGCACIKYSAAATKTTSHTFNNGATSNETKNDATSTANHYNFAHGVTTSNASASGDSFAFTTTSISSNGAALTWATFLLPAAPAGNTTNFFDFF